MGKILTALTPGPTIQSLNVLGHHFGLICSGPALLAFHRRRPIKTPPQTPKDSLSFKRQRDLQGNKMPFPPTPAVCYLQEEARDVSNRRFMRPHNAISVFVEHMIKSFGLRVHP